RNRMRENRTFGTVRGAPGNRRSYRRRKVTKEPNPRCGKPPGPDGFRGVGKNSLYIMGCRDRFRRSCLSSPADLLIAIPSNSLPP
ncbi:MAG: hypothetical protein C4518_15305, partial [Desulfobacteraceae bacterium]